MTARRTFHNYDKSPTREADRDGDWRDDAFCRANPDTWFADDPATTLEAKVSCLSCPVLNECRAYVADLLPSDGVWAGQLWVDGRPVDRNRRKAPPAPPTPTTDLPPCGTEQGYQSHRWRKTAKCEPCKAAHATYQAEYMRAKRYEEVLAARAVLAKVAADMRTTT